MGPGQIWVSRPESASTSVSGPPSTCFQHIASLLRIRHRQDNVSLRHLHVLFFDTHNAQIGLVLCYGKLPDRWWKLWGKRSEFFDDDGCLKPEMAQHAPVRGDLETGPRSRTKNIIGRSLRVEECFPFALWLAEGVF